MFFKNIKKLKIYYKILIDRSVYSLIVKFTHRAALKYFLIYILIITLLPEGFEYSL